MKIKWFNKVQANIILICLIWWTLVLFQLDFIHDIKEKLSFIGKPIEIFYKYRKY